MTNQPRFRPAFGLAVLLSACLLPVHLQAAEINIIADKIVRDADGVATATGTVEIQRSGETMTADKVRYDATSKNIQAEGNVHIVTDQSDIRAESGNMNSENKTGELLNAEVTMPGGETLSASRLLRIDEFTFKAFDPKMTTCPKDEDTWYLHASEGTLDQVDGVFKAKHARFEFAGVPLFYSPYWQQAIRRKSGFMLPFFAFGKRRGTEWALPYYFAPAPDWDATITPHWMTARGMMTETEVRHASVFGSESVSFEGLHDKVTSSSRGRLKGKAGWALPLDMQLALRGDEVNDRNYLADFARKGNEAALRYLTSSATLSQGFQYGSWSLAGIYNHDLSTLNNKATLQQYPNFNLNLGVPLFDSPATFYLLHNTTRYSNSNGAAARRDWRTYFHPYVTIPWNMLGGGIATTVTAGSTYTKYWLNRGGARKPSLRSGEFSVDSQMVFERINEARTVRHSIIPRIRYDLNVVRNQPGTPTFDSKLSPLRLTNLFSGNRYSGMDRVENIQRVAFLLTNNFETKSDPQGPARNVLSISGGTQYNIRSSRLNPNAAPTSFSNLLGLMTFSPLSNVTSTIEGEYDPRRSFWNRIADGITVADGDGDSLSAYYVLTNSELATTSEIFQASGKYTISERWRMNGNINYDVVQKSTQQVALGFTYTHPCWEIGIEAHSNKRPTGTTGERDVGASLLIGFKGLGSVASDAK